jgi:hypothetical protein
LGRGLTNSVEDRGQTERGSGGGSPPVRGSTQFANEWNRIVIRLLRMYIPWNWEFGSALAKLRNFGVEPPKHPSIRHWLQLTETAVLSSEKAKVRVEWATWAELGRVLCHVMSCHVMLCQSCHVMSGA